MYSVFEIRLDRLHGTETRYVQARTPERAAAVAEALWGGSATPVRADCEHNAQEAC